MPKIQICVFAYNLENIIDSSLDSIIKNLGIYEAEIIVIANGCKDNTIIKINDFIEKYSFVHCENIEMGDKANAWNVFTHKHYSEGAIAIYVDGDLSFSNNAIKNIIEHHLSEPNYNIITSVPWSRGRNSEYYREKIKNNYEVAGGLYLLSPTFMAALKNKSVRLPIGLIGDDSMIAYLAATNLEQNSDRPEGRIGHCFEAEFQYEPLNLSSITDIKLYFRRRVRYSIRYMQQSSIVPQLKVNGLQCMPSDARILPKKSLPPIRWTSSNLIFDIIAIQKLTTDNPTTKNH